MTEPSGLSLSRSRLATSEAPASALNQAHPAHASFFYLVYLGGLTTAVVLVLISGVGALSAPSFQTLIETVGLLASCGIAVYLLGEFLAHGARWALSAGLGFLLLAATQGVVALPLTLTEAAAPGAWYGHTLIEVVAAIVLLTGAIFRGAVPLHLRRQRLLGSILVATLWTVLAAVAARGVLPGADASVHIGLRLVSALLLLSAGIAFRRLPDDAKPISPWLAVALPVQAAAATEYAASSWMPDRVVAGDLFNLMFSLLILAALVVLVARAFYRLRLSERDLQAVDTLSLIPAIQDTKLLAGRIAGVIGESIGADACLLLAEAERTGSLAAHLAQVEARSENDVIVGYEEEGGNGRVTIGAALRASGKRLGLLVASRRGGPAFTREEISRLRALAAVAATMIERSLLYDEVAAGAILQERSRLAREIHDGLAQHIAFLKMRVAWMLRGSTIDREHLKDIEGVLETALVEARQAITTLRSGGDVSSAADAIIEYAQEFGQVSGLNVEVRAAAAVPVVGARPRVEVLRIVQEALNNVRKHAAADTVRVSIDSLESWLAVDIEDNGRGFEIAGEMPGHFGLAIMRERVESVGGVLEIRSRPSAGTRISIRVPPESAASLAG